MFKRIALFAATNIAVVLVLTVVLRLLGLDRMIDESGAMDYRVLLVFSLVWGMAGSLISLAISKWSAKRMTGARVIERPANATEQWLVETVARQARQAGIGMPEVAIFDSPEVNAFATGASRNNALVAVSSGLLAGMSRAEAEAVMAHEVSHVANGDMVTLTLIQGVLNAVVIFLSRIIGHYVDRVVFRNERGYGPGFLLTTIVMQVLLGVLATLIVRWFSRYREYRADAGGARLAGRDNMVAALERLRRGQHPQPLPEQLSAFGISGAKMASLFATHPPLEARIAALRSPQAL